MFGLAITALLAAWATDAANLAGVGSHDAATLANISDNISISGIILCGLIISGLGVLNDVTITQSSAVWELWELAPETSARQLFTSAMRIGRDHIASTVYTIAFAYAGAALPVLILVMLYERPLGDALTSAELSEEVIRTLVGSVGLVLADAGHHPDRRAGGQGHRDQGAARCSGQRARQPAASVGRRPAASARRRRVRQRRLRPPDGAGPGDVPVPTADAPRAAAPRCGADAASGARRRRHSDRSFHIAGAGSGRFARL